LPLILMIVGTKLWFIGALLARARAVNLRREAGKAWVAALANGGIAKEPR
jgi:heme exporter protein C